MGGAYSTIAADVVARYQRLLGKQVVFVTGTDEHGEKIAASAEKAGLTPKAHCDGIVARYIELWQKVRPCCNSCAPACLELRADAHSLQSVDHY